jgi:hypothetical protein
MGRIYTKAQAVITWLGEPVDNEELAFEITEDFDALDPARQEAVLRLLQKPYWSRIWIIQEFMLAQTVHIWCGDLSVNADIFDQPGRNNFLTRQKYGSRGWRILVRRNVWHKTPPDSRGFRLGHLIRQYYESESSVMHDRVYGLLGLVSPGAVSSAHIKPDYSKSMAEVVMDVLRFEWYTGASTSELRSDLHFFRSLFGVSNLQFVSTVSNVTECMQRHMFVLLVDDSITAPLCFVGELTDIQMSYKTGKGMAKEFKPRTLLSGLYKKVKNIRTRKLNEDTLISMTKSCSWKFNTQQGDLEYTTDKQMVDDSMRLLLPELMQASDTLTMGERETRAHSPLNLIDFQNMFPHSFDKDPWASASKPQQNQSLCENNTDYTSFTATNGVSGIMITAVSTRYWVWQDRRVLQIWTFEGSNADRHGLVVTIKNDGTWTVIGFAVFITAQLDADPSSVLTGGDSTPHELWIQLGLVGFLELQRRQILTKAQLKGIFAARIAKADNELEQMGIDKAIGLSDIVFRDGQALFEGTGPLC